MSGLRHAKDEELLEFWPVRVKDLQISLSEELDFLQDFFKSNDTALSLGSETMQSADSGGMTRRLLGTC